MKMITVQKSNSLINKCSGLLVLFILFFTVIFPKQISADVIGVDPDSPKIEVFNQANWTSVSSATLTMSGFTVTGAQSVTWNSDNLLYYAIIKVAGNARHLATVNPLTGVCTHIGLMSSTSFSTLTYNSTTGILYTMGGSGGPVGVAQCLFSVDINTAATSFLAGPYPVGTFGEVIAYNYTDNMIYHWSGEAPAANMEKIDPVTFVATPVAQTGDVHSEICGAVYLGGGIFASTDLVFQGGTSAFTISSAGVVDLEGSTPYKVRGLAYEDPVLPVELTSFISLVNTNNVTLNWLTATETNNSGFEIERRDARGETQEAWLKIGFVQGTGTTYSPMNYSLTDRNLNSGNYSYRLKQIDFNGNFEYFNLSNEVNVGVPANFELSQNYPNPFNPTTKIEYQLPIDGSVNISVFDNAGKEVASLVNEFKAAGYYAINLNAASLSSGVYFYKITSGNFSSVKKMMLLK